MSELVPIDDPVHLPLDHAAKVQSDLQRIALQWKRLRRAMLVLVLLLIEVAVVASIDFGRWNESVAHVMLTGGQRRRGNMLQMHFFATPEGMRAVPRDNPSIDQLVSEHGDFPPPGWDERVRGSFMEVALHAQGDGLFTPFVRSRTYRLNLEPMYDQEIPESEALNMRATFCAWLAQESPLASPEVAGYAAELLKGNRDETRIVWGLLLHDVAVLCGFLWCAWMLVCTPWPPFRRWRRARQGLCPYCSYDLLSDFSRGCPECGWGREP